MTKIDQNRGPQTTSDRPASAERADAAEPRGPQQQTGGSRPGDDFVNKAARTAGQVVGGVREIIGGSNVDAALEVAGRHKGKIAIAATVLWAPTTATIAAVAAAGRTVQNGVEGKFRGKSISEAAQFQVDDFKGLKDNAVSETRKTLGVLANAFFGKKE